MSTYDYADASKWRGTTILSVRKNGKIVVVGDGQVSAGNTVMKLARACVELAKDWRTDKYLRQLQAMMIVADKNDTYVLTGNGDVVEPDKLLSGSSIIAIGSGGNFALSAALAMDDYEKDAEVLAKKSMSIANKLCVFTNDNLTVETLKIK
jgi:ATP-dependent HslUV protease subunit HslV